MHGHGRGHENLPAFKITIPTAVITVALLLPRRWVWSTGLCSPLWASLLLPLWVTVMRWSSLVLLSLNGRKPRVLPVAVILQVLAERLGRVVLAFGLGAGDAQLPTLLATGESPWLVTGPGHMGRGVGCLHW